MILRGKYINLASSAVVALSSGVAVSLALTGGGVSTVVGVAIGVSLLPPLVNSGMCFGLTLIFRLYDVHPCNFQSSVSLGEQIISAGGMAAECNLFQISFVSFVLYVENMIGIIIGGYFMLRIKQVNVLRLRSQTWKEESKALEERMNRYAGPSTKSIWEKIFDFLQPNREEFLRQDARRSREELLRKHPSMRRTVAELMPHTTVPTEMKPLSKRCQSEFIGQPGTFRAGGSVSELGAGGKDTGDFDYGLMAN
jgi:hypothetical protein